MPRRRRLLLVGVVAIFLALPGQGVPTAADREGPAAAGPPAGR